MSKAHTKYDICKQCKGVCCTTYAGIYSPDDFTNPEYFTPEYFLQKLLSGKFTIDSDDTDILGIAAESRYGYKVYSVRPRHMDEPAIQNYTYFGICVNWSYDSGCSLEEEKRPYMCRMLIPLKDGGEYCSHDPADKADKISILKKWLPHQDILKQTKKMYEDAKHELSEEEFNKPESIFKYLDKIKKYKLGVINGEKTLG
jgi:hypothetical protein